MEEKKEKKKLNKKPLLICLAIALVFALIGIVDINVNAAESETYTVECLAGFMKYKTDGSTTWDDDNSGVWNLTSNSPMYGFYYKEYDTPTNARQNGDWWIVSKSPITGHTTTSVSDVVNGETWYIIGGSKYWGLSDSGSSRMVILQSDDFPIKRLSKKYGSIWDVISDYMDGTLETIIDYDTLPIDDDMVVPQNVKRNVFTNDVNDTGLVDTNRYIDIYDLISWDNTSDIYRIQIQRCPIVQIYKTPLLGKTTFVKEYLGEWQTEVVFDDISNEYLKQTDLKALTLNDNDIIHFKNSLTYDLGAFEQDFIYIGYRIRYIDCENEKASPWIILLPTHSKDSYESSVQYSNGSSDKTNNADGVFNDYRDLENVQDAIDDVKTENNFKDKYEIIDGDVDTQEATNWLYSVVNFIKGTPQVVGSVLGFLPQPILYGMYVTIFLGVIASGLAIIKALF